MFRFSFFALSLFMVALWLAYMYMYGTQVQQYINYIVFHCLAITTYWTTKNRIILTLSSTYG